MAFFAYRGSADSLQAGFSANHALGKTRLFNDRFHRWCRKRCHDLIALDKGEISVRKVVDQLIDKMEQYANFGFSYMQEKMEVDPNYFFKETAFLHTFLSFLNQDGNNDEEQLEEL